MAAANLLALLDDITAMLDDVAVLSKVAARKTAGVLGDDLALNAQQVAGVSTNREIPVVWAVAKGSLLNKAILVPLALLISAFLPWAVQPLLMIGGAFLCYEGAEKLAHALSPSAAAEAHREELAAAAANPDVDLVALEKEKIKGAIRTDFILSAEIIVIALGIVAGEDLGTRIGVLIAIAILMTVGVYGLVAAIVKIDDLGLWLAAQSNGAAQAIGRFLIALAPRLMRFLSVAGTAAMFLVGGSILLHGLPVVHHWIQPILEPLNGFMETVGGMLAEAALGVLAGFVILGVVKLGSGLFGKGPKAEPAH